jgi:transposase-like protein
VSAKKKHTVEEIVTKLREIEQLTDQGMSVAMAAKSLDVTEQTYYRWKARYGAMHGDEAERIHEVEQENTRLKRIISEQAHDIEMLQDLNEGKF